MLEAMSIPKRREINEKQAQASKKGARGAQVARFSQEAGL
jgi:hypothetical protein